MAMNGDQMGTAVADAIMATSPGGQLDSAEVSVLTQQWQVICTAIVDHIVSNGAATPGAFLDSLGGALSGKGGIE